MSLDEQINETQLGPDEPLSGGDAAARLAYSALWKQATVFSVSPAGPLSAGDVHRIRVATRRARSALRVFRDLLPAERASAFAGELKWLAAALGEVRDLDVYREGYADYRSTVPEEDRRALVPYEAVLEAERQEASASLVAALQSERYETLKADFAEWVAHERVEQDDGVTILDAGRAYLGTAKRRVLKRGKRIGPSSSADELHELRKEIKKFRYLLEFFEPFFHGELEAARKAAVRAQDVLGAHQDAFAANARVRRYAQHLSPTAAPRDELLALGQLIAAQSRDASDACRRFRERWPALETALAGLPAGAGE